MFLAISDFGFPMWWGEILTSLPPLEAGGKWLFYTPVQI
jgi:hypothetical protein